MEGEAEGTEGEGEPPGAAAEAVVASVVTAPSRSLLKSMPRLKMEEEPVGRRRATECRNQCSCCGFISQAHRILTIGVPEIQG